MIEAIGSLTLQYFASTAEFLRLCGESVWVLLSRIFTWRVRGRETLYQMYLMAVQSVPVIVFSLSFITIMLLVEFSFHMKLVLRQSSMVPAFSTVLMVRELGPTITGLLLASRIGAAIAAEIGSMKVTEQIDSLRLLSIDPVEYLTVPRWVASVFATVTLSVLALGVGILGGAGLATVSLGETAESYLNTMFVFTRYRDIWCCIAKAAIFGTIIPLVASHCGFRCRLGSEGVGNAATHAVVQSSLLIIIMDFVFTYLFYAI